MTYVVTENCVDCKFTDCVAVCPVDCFYETDRYLVIDPDDCIDCSACVPECPVEAIYADDELPEGQTEWLRINAEKAAELKNGGAEPITATKQPLPTAQEKKQQLGF